MATLMFEIRAAALYRIVGNAQSVMSSNDGDDGSMQNELLKDADACERNSLLLGMIFQMNCDAALAVFPTVDCAVLSKMVFYIAGYYKRHPEIASKISTMCFGHQVVVGDGYHCPTVLARSSARTRETALLNENFHKLGELISDHADVTVSTEFIDHPNHIFHPESQFIRVTAIV